MLSFKTYKNILNSLPTAVIVVDKKFRVRFINTAFSKFFSNHKGITFKEVTGCTQAKNCGKEIQCAVCPLKNLFLDCQKEGMPLTREILMEVETELGAKSARLRMHATAMNKNLLLGIVDNVYEQEIAKEMLSAQNIQQRLLPAGKEVGGVGYRYMYIPCREIGGDLPDVYPVNENDTFGVIADVSGKGISAGMLSAFVKAGFDKNEPSPSKAITQLNAKFQELNLDEKAYITVAAVRIDSDNQIVTYTIAGHNAPILLKSGYKISEIEMPAPPVSNWMPDYSYKEEQFTYKNKDLLVLLTDGVTECKNANGELFGIDRVESVLLRSYTAEQFIEKLKMALTEFSDNFDDDITAIAFDL